VPGFVTAPVVIGSGLPAVFAVEQFISRGAVSAVEQYISRGAVSAVEQYISRGASVRLAGTDLGIMNEALKTICETGVFVGCGSHRCKVDGFLVAKRCYKGLNIDTAERTHASSCVLLEVRGLLISLAETKSYATWAAVVRLSS
jgi:hypothetical protein